MALDYTKYTVLIVDDIPLNVMLVKKMLDRKSLKIRTASNGQKALESIAEQKPDLVFLDLMMPVLDGFGFLEQVRQKEELRDMKVVILSALNSEADIMKGLKAGANDFITKPIITERLYGCLDKQLDAIEAQAS